MLHIIVTLSAMALCLLIGLFIDRPEQHIRHKPTHRWLRCAICGNYQNTVSETVHCFNHDLPTYMLNVTQMQQRRITHHIDYLWTHPHINRQQARFIAFVMRLEDLTGDEWSTEAAIQIFENVGPASLLKFSEFLLALEEAAGARLDVNNVVTQFLVSEAMQDDTAKVTQN